MFKIKIAKIEYKIAFKLAGLLIYIYVKIAWSIREAQNVTYYH